MSYSVVTQYDSRMPSWPKNSSPYRLIACHDTEGGTGRAGALATIKFLIDTAAQRGASYHELWWYHEATDEFGVIRIVPPSRAAGSVAPRPEVYQPTQWVKDSLGSTWWDPNQGIYAVSIAGRVADVDRYAKNPKFLAHAHRRMLELWKELGVTRRAEHFQFQPSNRTDWGKALTPALGGLVTSDRYQPTEERMDWLNRVKRVNPRLVVTKAGASFRLSPDLSAASQPWVNTNDGKYVVVGEVTGQDFGAGPLWLVIVSGNGGFRVFHSQDVKSSVELADPRPLQQTINEQTAKIAGLQTQVSSLQKQVEDATSRAISAEKAAGTATKLREALTEFLS